MRLARERLSGRDGTTHRVLVAAGDGPWVDLRRSVQLGLEASGATPERADLLAGVWVPGSLSRGLQGGAGFIELAQRAVDAPPPEAVRAGEPVLGAALDPSSYRDFMVFEEHFRFGYEWQGKPVPEVMYELPVSYAGDPHSFIGPADEIASAHAFSGRSRGASNRGIDDSAEATTVGEPVERSPKATRWG